MRTKNFVNLMAMVFERCNVSKGLLPVTGYDGVTYYVGPTSLSISSIFPCAVTLTFQTNTSYAGFFVGSGSTPATENDYMLESIITSGISGSVLASAELDDDGNPTVYYDLTISNTGSNAVTIAEIGFKQSLYTTATDGGTSFSGRQFLLDRTVLDAPVTIASGDFAVIRYTLKTEIT